MTTSRNQIRRTSVDNSPPTGLLPGELAVEMGTPTRLWVGVPSSADPAQQKLVVDSDALAAAIAAIANAAPLVHTHPIADVAGLQAELDNLQYEIDTKADISHYHGIADVSGLQTVLDVKTDLGHQHAISDVSGLRNELDLISSIAGGGNIFKHTHQISEVLGLQTELDTKSDIGHLHDFSQITGTPPAPGAHTHSEADITGLGALARKNTVGSADINNGAITQSKMAPNSVGATEIVDNSVNGQKIALGGDASGDIMAYDGSNWVRIPAGASGQVLHSGAVPYWGNPSAAIGGCILAAKTLTESCYPSRDVAIAGGPYSALKILITGTAGLNKDGDVTMQLSDGATFGSAMRVYHVSGANLSVDGPLFDISSGSKSVKEYWVFNAASPARTKNVMGGMTDLVDSIPTNAISLLRFASPLASAKVKVYVVGFK